MPIAHRNTRRHFTDAARIAAHEARRRKSLLMLDPQRPEVFVVRGEEDEHRFAWQIRRFGGVVLRCSQIQYHNIHEAKVAGIEALRAFVAGNVKPQQSPLR